MKVDFDVSGWDKDQTYEKFDVVFFSGDAETGCNPFESGYYYATAANVSTVNTALGPTGINAKWTRSFPSTPSYNSSVSFNAKTFKNTFGDGYYSLLPKSHNNLEIQYNLNFNGRTEKESKAILHFLGHRFEEAYTGAGSGIVGALPDNATEYQGGNVLTGFNFTPFAPYNQTGTFFCEEFDHQQTFTNVHDVTAVFNNAETSLTNWRGQVIPLDETAKYWAAGQSYGKFDIVYYSGHNVSNFSGFYYNSGNNSEVTATVANGPVGDNTLWTKDVFYFKPSDFSIPQEPRFLKSELNRDYVKRWGDGINTNLLNINLNFEGKSEKEAKAITHFLINKKGYESFKFSPPAPYHQNDKIFVCRNWADNFVFSDNRSLNASFEEMPLDLNKVPRIFKTYILDTNGSIIAPYEKQNGVDGSVFNVNYGIFMTGFSSGTGFYLLNSGDQKIISTLSLTGHNAKSGVYKFKENSDSRYKIDGGNSAIFELDQKDSGYFEVEFSTTGKSGARGSWYTDDLDTEGYFFYFSGHGGAGYTYGFDDGWPRPSQLTVTSTDQYNYNDPSGMLKIDLTGNAEALKPGPIATFKVDAVEGDIFITGGWTYSEPLTATGILLEVSGTAPDAAVADPHGATGLLKDEPTGTTSFAYPVIPGKTHHFRIRTQNIDLIGGNVNGGTLRKVEAASWVHANGSVTDTALNVSVNLVNQNLWGLKSVNLNSLASAELTRLQTDLAISNSQLDVNVFSKIRFNFAPNMLVYSSDISEPAVDTGEKFTSTYGAGLDPVPIEIYIPKTTQIIGAGGRGASVMSDRTYGTSVKAECPVAFSVTSAQRATLSSADVKYGSLPELAGVGPVSRHYLDGKMDGSYAVGVAPNNGQDGGTALSIHADYAGSSVKLYCRGFIGGGGGGGGAGGTRDSNITSLKIPWFCFKKAQGDGRKIWVPQANISTKDGVKTAAEGVMLPYMRAISTSSFTAGGHSHLQPSLQNRLLVAEKELPEGWKDEDADDKRPGNTVVFEARPGGGGGGGAGYSKTDAITVSPDGPYATTTATFTESAAGGAGCDPFVSNVKVYGSRTIEVTEKSHEGGRFKIQFPFSSGTQASVRGGSAGQGATAPIQVWGTEAKNMTPGTYHMQNPSGLIVAGPDDRESYRNAGGVGGYGGGFGQDGRNGEHPIQAYTDRHIGLVKGTQYGPEPRTFGFGGTGGLCIDTNGALVDFYPKDNIPCSGQDNKTEQDNKNSELYRNRIGKGAYLTPKYKSATTIETSGHLSVGLISGLKGTRKLDGTAGDTINFDGVSKKVDNQSNAVNGSYPTWKAFNQTINGDFDDYVLMDQDNFPYYLIYDFGAGNTEVVKSYTLSSAGASADYYNDTRLETIFGEVFAPTEWKLFGSNANSDLLLRDSDMVLLHHMRNFSYMPGIRIVKEGSKVRDASRIDDPGDQLFILEAEGAKHNSYVCIPGQVRLFTVPGDNMGAYRYYILKILGADGNQGKVKIADFGLRGSNESYAGFINLIQGQ